MHLVLKEQEKRVNERERVSGRCRQINKNFDMSDIVTTRIYKCVGFQCQFELTFSSAGGCKSFCTQISTSLRFQFKTADEFNGVLSSDI